MSPSRCHTSFDHCRHRADRRLPRISWIRSSERKRVRFRERRGMLELENIFPGRVVQQLALALATRTVFDGVPAGERGRCRRIPSPLEAGRMASSRSCPSGIHVRYAITAATIRPAAAPRGVIRLAGRFLLYRRKEIDRPKAKRFVLPGSRLRQSDMLAAAQEPAGLRGVSGKNPVVVVQSLPTTLSREIHTKNSTCSTARATPRSIGKC